MKFSAEMFDLTTNFEGMVTAINSDQGIVTEKCVPARQPADECLKTQPQSFLRPQGESALFTKMNEALLASTSEAEAYAMISEIVTQLFPGDSGALYVLNNTGDVMEVATSWGPLPTAARRFLPNECWAYRRSKGHLFTGLERWCVHVKDIGHMYVCLPLLMRGATFGILNLLDGQIKKGLADEIPMLEKCVLARNLADQLGRCIANLRLRQEPLQNQSVAAR
jgi:hypothetical protein